MLGPLGDAFDRWRDARRERRAEQDRLEAAFEDDCRAVIIGWAQDLQDQGVATFEIEQGPEAPGWIDVTPTRPDAAGAWIGFDYPSFCIRLPHAERSDGYDATAELFGEFDERLVEIEQRLDAIAGGRLRWRYKPSKGSGCVLVQWLGADGEPFLESAYSGAPQGEHEASGQTAPFAA